MTRLILASLTFAILLTSALSAGENPPANAAAKPKATASGVVVKVATEPGKPATAAGTTKTDRKPAKVSDAPVTVTQLQDLNKATKEQIEAVKKYAEARQKSSAAATTLARLATAIASKGGLATEEDLKKIDDAKKALEAAVKSSAKLRDEARKVQAAAQAAAARATAARRVYGGNVAMRVREDVDVKDPIERFLLLLPGGPVVVQTAISVEGKPFRTKREALLDEMLAAADSDKDGKATWAEGFQSPIFTLGRVRVANDQQMRQYLNLFDKDKDEIVDRGELRAFLARYFQGGAFFLTTTAQARSGYSQVRVLANGRVMSGGGANANVQALLDVNSDGRLTKEEIANAPDRLKSRDANDDDLLYSNEIAGSASGRVQRTATGGSARQPVRTQTLALMLGPTANAAELFAALTQRYRNDKNLIVAESFAGVPGLFEALDADKDGLLQQQETLGLNKVEPHVELQIALGDKDNGGLKVGRLGPGFKPSGETKTSLAMTLPGVNLTFVANTAAARTYDYSRTATSYLQRYDGDKNGYIDEKELGTNFARMAQMWDTDKDGKIFAKEIEASYKRTQAPMMSQVRASALTQGNPLFSTLDLSGDGRLSLREMRTSPKRILTFDKDKDGEISPDEIPTTIAVTFQQGYGNYTDSRPVQRNGSTTARPAPKDQPEWFTRMDRNGDGDVTLKEFLGEKADFEKLDTNKDGFIEPAEAKAAAKGDSAE